MTSILVHKKASECGQCSHPCQSVALTAQTCFLNTPKPLVAGALGGVFQRCLVAREGEAREGTGECWGPKRKEREKGKGRAREGWEWRHDPWDEGRGGALGSGKKLRISSAKSQNNSCSWELIKNFAMFWPIVGIYKSILCLFLALGTWSWQNFKRSLRLLPAPVNSYSNFQAHEGYGF